MNWSLPQLEQTLEGISKNNKAAQEAYDNGGVEEKSAADLINYLKANNGEL